MKIITAFFMAWGNFLKIPCPVKKWDSKLNKLMLGFLPSIGAIVGLALTGAWLLMDYLKQWIPSEDIRALAIFVVPLALCGFLHLDGFMDVSDAILSRRSLEERQRILKDSSIGAFAVISVVVLMIAYFAAIKGLIGYDGKDFPLGALFLIPILSRTFAGNDVLRKKKISLSQYAGDGTSGIKASLPSIIQLAVFLAIACIGGSERSIILTCIVVWVQVLAIIGIGQFARKQLGGMNGDIAGYEIVVSECVGLLTLAIGLGTNI